MDLFYDETRNKVRNPKLFQSRILGLTSYFKTGDRSLLPEVTIDKVEPVPMSKYQFLNYSNIRKKEIEQDKNKRKKKGVKKAVSKTKESHAKYKKWQAEF